MPASTPTLRDMIQEARDRGQTYEQLEAASIDPGTGEQGVSRSTLNNIVIGKVKQMPKAELLRGVAAALGKPYEQVRRAAIAQWLPADEAEPRPDALMEQAQWLAEEALRVAQQDVGEKAARREGA